MSPLFRPRARRGHPLARPFPGHLLAGLSPHSMHPVHAHGVSTSFEKDLNPAIPISWIVGGDFAHGRNGGRILRRQP